MAEDKAKSEKTNKPPVQRGPRDSKYYNLDDTVKVLVTDPGKKGKSAERFKLWKNGATLRASLEAGLTPADIRHDVQHKFIAISHVRPVEAEYPPLVKKERKKKSDTATQGDKPKTAATPA